MGNVYFIAFTIVEGRNIIKERINAFVGLNGLE